jgi:hypothetical protein
MTGPRHSQEVGDTGYGVQFWPTKQENSSTGRLLGKVCLLLKRNEQHQTGCFIPLLIAIQGCDTWSHGSHFMTRREWSIPQMS